MSVRRPVRAVPVLMYHAVTDDPAPGARSHVLAPAAFAEQMARLYAAGFTAVTATGAADLLAGDTADAAAPAKPIAITFDDGYADFVTNALPALQRYGFTATVFVTTGYVAGAEAVPPPDRMLAWTQVAELAARGVEIGGHSHTHPQLDRLPPAAARDEVTRCKELLEDRLGRAVATFAYPYGYSSASVRRAVASAGYTAAFAVSNALARSPGHDRFAYPRLTVSDHTNLARFGDVVHGRRIPLAYARERALTKGYALVRRSRQTVAALTRRPAPDPDLPGPHLRRSHALSRSPDLRETHEDHRHSPR